MDLTQMRVAGRACLADGLEECAEGGALADGDSVDLIDVGRVTEIAARRLAGRWSSPTTVWSSPSRVSSRLEPMKPATPVKSQVLGCAGRAARRSW